MSIGLDEASLVGIFMESVLFGVYTVLLIGSLYVLVAKSRRTHTLNKVALAVTLTMYSLALTHISIDLQRILNGFIRLEGGEAIAYFSNPSDKLFLVKTGIYGNQTLLGDAFLIYRLYSVWGGDKRVVIPAYILLTANIITGYNLLVREALVKPGTIVFSPDIRRWAISFFTLTLVTNSTCTILIAGKIYANERRTSTMMAFRTQSLRHILVIIVESGAIYSASVVVLMATYLTNNWSQLAILDSIVQIVGIVFSLIIVRIGLGFSSDGTRVSTRARSAASSVQMRTPQFPMHDIGSHRSRNVTLEGLQESDEERSTNTLSGVDIDRRGVEAKVRDQDRL